MRIKETSRLITIFIIFLSCLGAFTLLVSYNLMEKQKNASIRLTLSLESIDKLIKGSDVLTTAIRNYAATGDKQYKNDFHMEVAVTRARDKAVMTLKEVGLLSSELEQIENAKANSDALISLENEAFSEADRGNFSCFGRGLSS